MWLAWWLRDGIAAFCAVDGIVFPEIFTYNTVQSVNDGDGYLVDVNFG